MEEINQQWALLEKRAELFHARSAYIWCDREQHLLILNYPVDTNTPMSSAGSVVSLSEHSSVISGQSTHTPDVQTVIYLERIEYIQRGGGTNTGRSARDYHQLRATHQLGQNVRYGPEQKRLEIYYCTDHPRSEYLYKSISFQLRKLEYEFAEWINALYTVIHEAKNVTESAKRDRWFLREYEKLRRSSGGLTFDSINGWLNSHIGLVGEKANVEKQIKQNKTFRRSNEITSSVFRATYNHFFDEKQEKLIKILMSDSIEENRMSLQKFATRLMNNEIEMVPDEIENIRQFLGLNTDQTDVSLKQCINYLWSDANSVFEPISRSICTHDMNQPLNHYWISSSHNTYLAKTQLFNPASVHCYIQALLKGCRCVEIDVMDSRTGAEPEITHKNTRIKPIPLRDVLEAIVDYAFVTSEYPVIVSIENHCSPEQRSRMARMFIEIFGDSLLQLPLSSSETELPSPNQLKRKILLKDSKINASMVSQANVDVEEQSELSPRQRGGRAQLFDCAKNTWLDYNYTITNDDVFLARDDETQTHGRSDDDFSDEENDENVSDGDLTQIWYHGNISHEDARRLLLSNAGYEIGMFLVRKSLNKHCYCVSYLAADSVVKSTEINEERNEDGKCTYTLANKTFESIPDLVAYYRTYDFAETVAGSTEKLSTRLGKPLPGVKWPHELRRQQWYQPDLTRQQAEDLLNGIGEEMTFLIRESSNRAGQGYTISVYTNGSVRHSPILRDGSDLMLMSLTFTSLIDLVNFYRRKPIFRQLTLKNPAKPYSDFFLERSDTAQQLNKDVIFKPLGPSISFKVDDVSQCKVKRNPDDRSVKVEIYLPEANETRPIGYLFQFNSLEDWESFSPKRSSAPSALPGRSFEETSNRTYPTGSTVSRVSTPPSSSEQARLQLAEYNKLIIYCQGVKLKELGINKPQDLLDKIKSCKEMISLNFVKASVFCTDDVRSMILFNQGHFTRIYPDFSRRSWNSYNFEPVPYWLAGCQMIALNFQMPDRPMHCNAGRFATNGGCGYLLMPNYIRSFKKNTSKVETISMLLKIRIVAVRHLRTNQAKSISKIQIKTLVINKQSKTTDNQICSTTINGPCGIWDSKQSSSKHHDHLHAYNRLQSDDSDVDLLYFEVLTDNQDFCGQAAIPLSSLRPGIRSVQLYDKFNERLDMSALLVDIIYKSV